MSLDQKLHETTYSSPAWFAHFGTAGHVDGNSSLCIPDINMSDAGSGIVAGSEPAAEDHEVDAKFGAMLGALGFDQAER